MLTLRGALIGGEWKRSRGTRPAEEASGRRRLIRSPDAAKFLLTGNRDRGASHRARDLLASEAVPRWEHVRAGTRRLLSINTQTTPPEGAPEKPPGGPGGTDTRT